MKKYRQRESEVGLVGSTERLELYGDVEKLGESIDGMDAAGRWSVSARYSIFSSVTIHLEISGGCVLKPPLSSTVNRVDERICAAEPPNRYDLSRRFSQLLLRPFSRKLRSTRFEGRILVVFARKAKTRRFGARTTRHSGKK